MKKIFTILILAFIVSNCSKNEYERELIGNWNNFPLDFRTDIKFYKDSFVSYNYNEKDIGTWKADSDKIYFVFKKSLRKHHKDSLTYFYRLSLNKDTLYSRLTSSKINEDFVLLRVKNTWKHYLNEIDLEIDLPEPDFELTRNNSMYNGIDLYVGYKNEKLIVKAQRRIQQLNKDIENLVLSERAMRTENEEKYLYFNLITDKNINEKEVDSIKRILKTFPSMKIFRVYENKTADYGKYDCSGQGDLWNWYGRYE